MNIDEKIAEILWPEPFAGSGKPIQVATSSGLPPFGKTFVAPYNLTNAAIKVLIGEVLEYVKHDRAPFRVEDELDRGTNIGINVAIDWMEEKQRELGL